MFKWKTFLWVTDLRLCTCGCTYTHTEYNFFSTCWQHTSNPTPPLRLIVPSVLGPSYVEASVLTGGLRSCVWLHLKLCHFLPSENLLELSVWSCLIEFKGWEERLALLPVKQVWALAFTYKFTEIQGCYSGFTVVDVIFIADFCGAKMTSLCFVKCFSVKNIVKLLQISFFTTL